MIEFNATLFIQAVNFILLMIVLNFLLFRPVRNLLKQRKDEVESSHSRADALAGEIESRMAKYESQLEKARIKGNEERNQVRSTAQEEEKKILEEAQGMAIEERESVRSKVRKEMAAAQKTLKGEVDSLGREIASKVLGKAV